MRIAASPRPRPDTPAAPVGGAAEDRGGAPGPGNGLFLRVIGSAVAIALMVAPVLALRRGPPGDAEAIRSRVAAVGRMPSEVGSWRGRDLPFVFKDFERAGVLGAVVRRYEDRRTGSVATVMLVCGPPGPIASHTPEMCFGGAGFMLVGPPGEVGLPGRADVFFSGKFAREGMEPEGLRIYWAWKVGGPWLAPERPRMTFAEEPLLYKLYVARRVADPAADDPDDPCRDLLAALVPALDRVLDPGTAGATGRATRPTSESASVGG